MNEKQPLATIEKQSRGDGSSNADAKAEAKVNDSTGKVLAIISFGVSILFAGVVIATLYFESVNREQSQQLVDAKIKAAIAPSEEKMRTSATDSRLALDRVDKTVAQLEAHKLIKLENH